jgi:hypothetical protein
VLGKRLVVGDSRYNSFNRRHGAGILTRLLEASILWFEEVARGCLVRFGNGFLYCTGFDLKLRLDIKGPIGGTTGSQQLNGAASQFLAAAEQLRRNCLGKSI